ncbi:unnamed protein product, partial [Effrenium voratum]
APGRPHAPCATARLPLHHGGRGRRGARQGWVAQEPHPEDGLRRGGARAPDL